MLKNLKPPDMAQCKENKQILFFSLAVVLFLSYFFYKSLWGVLLLFPVGILFFKQEVKKKQQKQKDQLSREFREMILSISANLQAGYAMENALYEARNDMIVMYGEQAEIVSELNQIIKGVHNQIPVEQLFLNFGKRSGIQEIADFAIVFSIAKRTGGDMIAIIRSTVEVISEKIEVQNHIRMLISSKLFEQQIMNLVPFGIVLYVSITSKGFFDSLYGNMRGILIMSVCLLLYLVSYGLSQKIIQIKV